MKTNSAIHVFVVNSHIVYICAIGIIRRLGLKREEVVFILDRNYSPPCFDSFASSVYQLDTIENKIFMGSSFVERLQDLLKGVKVIDKIAHSCDRYYAYVPQCYFLTFFLLCRHDKCIYYSIMEEGTGSSSAFLLQSYSSHQCLPSGNRQAPFRRILSVSLIDILGILLSKAGNILAQCSDCILRVLSGFRLPSVFGSQPFLQDDYCNAYHLHPKAFQTLDRTVFLEWPDLSFLDQECLPDSSWIFALDYGQDVKLYDINVFLEVCSSVFARLLDSGINVLFVKPHPFHESSPDRLGSCKLMFEQLAPRKLNLRWLPSDFLLEAIPGRKKFNFIVCMSSVAHYARLINPDSNVCVLYRELLAPNTDTYTRISSIYEDLPSFFDLSWP